MFVMLIVNMFTSKVVFKSNKSQRLNAAIHPSVRSLIGLLVGWLVHSLFHSCQGFFSLNIDNLHVTVNNKLSFDYLLFILCVLVLLFLFLSVSSVIYFFSPSCFLSFVIQSATLTCCHSPVSPTPLHILISSCSIVSVLYLHFSDQHYHVFLSCSPGCLHCKLVLLPCWHLFSF